jgi:hypothetical protein
MTVRERIAKLIDVKSGVTGALTLVFCYLSVIGQLSTEFMTVYTTVIAFYFGTQTVKKE